MTDITAGRLHRAARIIVHPLTVRITHWLNALAIFIMIMSGWRVYNSDPIFPFSFPVWLTLGGSYDGSVDIHNEDGLAGALQFRLPHHYGVYNAVQKTLYLGVLAAGMIMVLSGLAIWKPGQFQELTWLFGGFGVARVIHFLGMAGIVLFLIVHIALVVIVPKTLPTMITGRAPANDAHSED